VHSKAVIVSMPLSSVSELVTRACCRVPCRLLRRICSEDSGAPSYALRVRRGARGRGRAFQPRGPSACVYSTRATAGASALAAFGASVPSLPPHASVTRADIVGGTCARGLARAETGGRDSAGA